jgi:uncharacterized integral membrane protein
LSVRFWFIALAALTASVLLVYAALRNSGSVAHVDWVFGSANDVPLWRVLATTALLGGIAAATALCVPVIRLRLRLRRAERRIAQLEQEVHGLRTLPVDDYVRDPGRGEA